MKALVKSEAKRGISMQDKPIPTIGPNDILIKIRKTSICGTDLHIYNWDKWAQKTIPVPMTIGHEYVGVIAKIGSEVSGFNLGERVTGEGHLACGQCRNCRRGRLHLCHNTIGIGVNRDGAFAEYVSVPATNVIKVNKQIPDEWVSIMDPLGNATHTTLSFPIIGEDVLITGSGLIGSMCIAIARFAGARNIIATETNPYRLELARKMGATKVVNPMEENLHDVLDEFNMQGFDIGLECSGNPQAFNDMVHHMYNSGKISILGIPPENTQVDWNAIIFKGLTLKGIYGREMFETWYHMEQMLLSGLDISSMITHTFKVDDYLEAFELMASGKCGKVLLDWE